MLVSSLDCSHVKIDYFAELGLLRSLVRIRPAPLIFYKYASIAADHVDHS